MRAGSTCKVGRRFRRQRAAFEASVEALMRSLALATSYPKRAGDGTAPFIREISHGLTDHGLEVDLLVPDHPELSWPEGDPPVRLHSHRYLPRWASEKWFVWGYAGALADDRRLRRAALAVLPLACVSTFSRCLERTRRRDPDVLHAHWVLPAGPIVATVARLTGKPYVVSLHGSGTYVAERLALPGRAARFALSRAAAVTACSSDLGERAVRLGADAERVTVIPYGVDAERFRPETGGLRARVREELGLRPERVVALAVGRLVAKKGFRHLISALVDGPDIHLVLAGSGDLAASLRRQVRSHDLGHRVTFLGAVSHDRVRELFAAADLWSPRSTDD